MSEAPERIWVEKSISETGTHGSTAWPDKDKDCIEYVRTDVSDALVAAAREKGKKDGLKLALDVLSKQRHTPPIVSARITLEDLITKDTDNG